MKLLLKVLVAARRPAAAARTPCRGRARQRRIPVVPPADAMTRCAAYAKAGSVAEEMPRTSMVPKPARTEPWAPARQQRHHGVAGRRGRAAPAPRRTRQRQPPDVRRVVGAQQWLRQLPSRALAAPGVGDTRRDVSMQLSRRPPGRARRRSGCPPARSGCDAVSAEPGQTARRSVIDDGDADAGRPPTPAVSWIHAMSASRRAATARWPAARCSPRRGRVERRAERATLLAHRGRAVDRWVLVTIGAVIMPAPLFATAGAVELIGDSLAQHRRPRLPLSRSSGVAVARAG